MLEIAGKIIDQAEGEFEPSEFVDSYEEAVRDLIDRKRKGHKPARAARPASDDSNVVDLMEALRRSIGAGTGGGDRRRRDNDNVFDRASAARRSAPRKTAPTKGRRGGRAA